MERIDVVLDLQYGSTGKGLLVGWLAARRKYDTIVTTWAPNAGHTLIDDTGRKFVHTQLALGIVSPLCKRILLGPGSVIDPVKLLEEINSCNDLIQANGISIAIHPHAAVVRDEHRERESTNPGSIGSTRKGVGAALADRISRGLNANVAKNEALLEQYVVTPAQYQRFLQQSCAVLVEGAQGYSLSMYHGFYPYTTSRDVSTWQILADAGISFSDARTAIFEVYGTARTYPIRVAHRFNDEGVQTENSGPFYPDQHEISFESIGQPQELTTVTQLPRRLFTFSGRQIQEAIHYNGARKVFLNFVNYVRSQSELFDIVDAVERGGYARVAVIGVGPSTRDVIEIDNITEFPALNGSQRRAKIYQSWKDYRHAKNI